jgi:hypothetical protein
MDYHQIDVLDVETTPADAQNSVAEIALSFLWRCYLQYSIDDGARIWIDYDAPTAGRYRDRHKSLCS